MYKSNFVFVCSFVFFACSAFCLAGLHSFLQTRQRDHSLLTREHRHSQNTLVVLASYFVLWVLSGLQCFLDILRVHVRSVKVPLCRPSPVDSL